VRIFVNGEPREVSEPVRLSDLIAGPDDAPVRRGIAVALDGVVVPRARHAETELHEGARIEIVTAVQGG
jgi:sulfur carrier protein